VKSILKYPHPKLRAPNGRVTEFGEPLKKLTNEMFNVMYQLCSHQVHWPCLLAALRLQSAAHTDSHICCFRDDGAGLAAPQVGVNLKLMVFNPKGERGKGQELVLANPKIISTAKTKDLEQEGCLSFKNQAGIHVLGDVEVRYPAMLSLVDCSVLCLLHLLRGVEAAHLVRTTCSTSRMSGFLRHWHLFPTSALLSHPVVVNARGDWQGTTLTACVYKHFENPKQTLCCHSSPMRITRTDVFCVL
jgi:peptide deformylase